MLIWISIAWRNVWGNKRRSLSAIMTIAVGTTAIILSYGYINFSFIGLSRSIVQGGMGNIQVFDNRLNTDFEDYPLQFGISQIDAGTVSNILTKSDTVKRHMKRLKFSGVISVGDISTIFQGTGIEPKLERRLNGRNAVGGATSGKSLSSVDANQVVLAKDLAKKLKVKVGDDITLLTSTVEGGMNGIDLTVVGTYDTGVPIRNGLELKVPLKTVQTLLLTEKISRIVIELNEITETKESNLAIRKNIDDNLSVKAWYDLAPYFKAVENIYYSIFSVMGSIILLVVLLSTSNVMNTSVMERVAEIGTMRAFGISEGKLKTSFVFEGIIIAIFGSLLGIIISMIGVIFINSIGYIMPPPPAMSVGYPLMILPTVMSILLTMITMMIIGVIASYISISKVLKKKVVEQLNYV